MNNKNKILLGLFCLLVLSPNLLSWEHQTTDSIAVNVVIVLLCLSFLSRMSAGLFVLLPFALFAPLEMIYIGVYGQPSSAHLLGVLIETNQKEFLSFLDGVGWQLAGVILTTLTFGIFTLYQSIKSQWRWQGRSRVWVLIMGVLVAVTLFAQDNLSTGEDESTHEATMAYQIEQGDGRLITASALIKSYPAGVFFRVKSFLSQITGLRKAAEKIESFQFNAEQLPASADREIYVLVIGETGRADRWQLNGYHRETTPLLSKTQGAVSLSDTITGWAWTRMSVPVIITRKQSSNQNVFFPEKSIVSAFGEAGFKTYWLTTQGPLGLHESSVALHAQEADETRFLSLTDYQGDNIYDGALLKPLKEVLAKDEKKQFIVLHTLGSHYDYSNRYPKSFDRFLPSLKGNKQASLHKTSQREVMNNSYDNSILYTDYVLSQFITALKNTGEQAALFYTSDHGENLFDNECLISGHGHGTEADFRVASLWWNSEKYESVHPEKVTNLKNRHNKPLTTEHVFNTLLDAADIRYPDEKLSQSIISKQWKPAARWTQVRLDFDKSDRDPVCRKLISAK